MPGRTRFRDGDGATTTADYTELVHCPHCHGLAEVIYQRLGASPGDGPSVPREGRVVVHPGDVQQMTWWGLWRVVCSRCTFYAEPPASSPHVTRDEACDRAFGLPLWLQTPCAGHVLWAWNEWHLDFMERYVAADLRERSPNINRSLASRLPAWIKSAKHRDEVLKGIRRLRTQLAEATSAR
jgi:hypothetical protein